MKAHIQVVTNKLINARTSEINKDDTKKVYFKVSEANAEAWVEETMKKINEKNGLAGKLKLVLKSSHFASTVVLISRH